MDDGLAKSKLQALGFSEIEALVYCFLLQESPATGYRISKGIGKAAANVYAAIETLAQKGALLVDDSERRQCRAVDPKELIASLERQLKDDLSTAEHALSTISAATPDQRIYKLETASQTFARIRQMIKEAREYILVDAFPIPLSMVVDDLRHAADRGVTVAVESYGDNTPDLSFAVSVNSPDVFSADLVWPGSQINIATDAREHLLALLDRNCERVLQSVWSNSAYLSCLQHSYMAASLIARHVENTQANSAMDGLEKLILTTARPSGLGDLLSLYAKPKHELKNDAA